MTDRRSSVFTTMRRPDMMWWVVAAMVVFPFVVALVEGYPPSSVFTGEAGNAKFLQSLAIEVFILALYAISYDLVLGVTGLLSFGHAMFFAVGAYGSGILLKSFGWPFWAMIVGVMIFSVLQALLFAAVLPRVKGIAFALVTLGLSSVFYIVVQSSELADYAGGDVGLQGVPIPAWIDTNTQRFRMYLLTLAILVIVYVVYRRIIESPTGAVLLAARENESRALGLGYNTFWFKLFALTVSSVTAATAGTLWMMQQPIVTPQVAGLGWTVAALLIILIGGMGTLSGAIVGAAIFRLMSFYLDKFFGGISSVIIGVVYIGLVLFLPHGIVGTWRMRSFARKSGYNNFRHVLGGDERSDV